MTKEIPLTQGKVAIVDDEDFEMLSRFKWCARKSDGGLLWYACRKERINGRQHQQQMHRLILNAPAGLFCDHINGNGLDNRRCNIRLATPQQNGMNQRVHAKSKTGFKGVTVSTCGKYQAQIKVNGKLIYLGSFADKTSAAIVYNEAAIKYHGEFANLNKV